MPLPFRIFKVQDDGDLQFVEEAETLEDARERVGNLARLWPGEYIVQNEETGEHVVISQTETSADKKRTTHTLDHSVWQRSSSSTGPLAL
jgi:predicted transcriptional regulator of viral defense system